VAIFATIAIFTAVSLGMDRSLLAEAGRVRFSALGSNDTSFIGARSLGGFFETPNGELLSYGDLEARGYTGGMWNDERGEIYATAADLAAKRNVIAWNVELLVPGRRYPEVVVRESAVLGGAALLAGGLAFAVVRRRRPY